jgi:lysophospholipid acyltransferase (LPLAT)-like uncharacterized protein
MPVELEEVLSVKPRSFRDSPFLARFVCLVLKSLSATWRFRETIPMDCLPILQGRQIAVIVFWHGRMMPICYRFRRTGVSALVSLSRDGDVLETYLSSSLKYCDVVRGSSGHGSHTAFRVLLKTLKSRSCLMAPDGPRGPLHHAKAGALAAAARSGVPVMVVGWSSDRTKALRSWDRMEIPYPFSKVHIRYQLFEPENYRADAETLERFNRALSTV